MLRIVVFGLILINIFLIAVWLLQPAENDGQWVGAVSAKTDDQMIGEASSGIERLPRIKLLQEELQAVAPPTETKGSTAAMDIPGAHACIRLGPFDSESELASLQSELQSQFERVSLRETKTIVDKGYWVFLRPYSTRSEAVQVADKLTAAGASEFYVVPGGKSVNAISLGVYVRRERAEERRDQIQSLGLALNITISPQTELRSSFWLEAGPVDAFNPVLLPIAIDHPEAHQLQVSCTLDPDGAQKTVASDDLPPDPISQGADDSRD